jgi:CheY-like chemotaxis protein
MKNTILIVDDEKILSLMDKMLSRSYNTIIARNGKEGLERFTDNKEAIKLIVTDINMPIMSGVDMVTAIRKIAPSVPVIFVTGQTVKYDGDHILIQKPFNVPDLLEAVKTIMNH